MITNLLPRIRLHLPRRRKLSSMTYRMKLPRLSRCPPFLTKLTRCQTLKSQSVPATAIPACPNLPRLSKFLKQKMDSLPNSLEALLMIALILLQHPFLHHHSSPVIGIYKPPVNYRTVLRSALLFLLMTSSSPTRKHQKIMANKLCRDTDHLYL
jgi:hypothetical protein